MRRATRRLGLLIPLCAVGLAACAQSAQAGAYQVVACGGSAGGAQNAFAAAADRGMAAYSVCPNTPSSPATGLVTRASATAGRGAVPYFAGAYQVFEAPVGASLASASFDLAAIRLASYWAVGVVAFDGDFNVGDLPYGCYPGTPGCGVGTPSFFGPVTVPLNGRTRFRFETRCLSPTGCDISASGFEPGMRALFSAANVIVRVQDSTAPSVVPLGGSLFAGGWLRGDLAGYSRESDNVGIMFNRTSIDGQIVHSEDFRDPGWPGWLRCDFTRRRPCSDVPGAGSFVNSRGLEDGAHSLRVEAIDAAGNAGSAQRTILVDNTPPARVNATVDGGERWRRSNDFVLRWATPPDQAAAISAVHYRLCVAGGTCTHTRRVGDAVERLTLGVPGPGDNTLRLWLEDAAGNAEPAHASDVVHLRFDDVPPKAVFELLDETDPRRLDVRVADFESGVSSGVIEIRRTGHRQWHPLFTTFDRDTLSADVDDLALADGTYDARARVLDHAGNEAASYERDDGAKMQLTLPLRTASRIILDAGTERTRRCKRGRRKRMIRCRTQRRAPHPGARLRGRLETADGKRLPGSEVTVLAQPRTGGGFRNLTTARTDPRGNFSHPLGRGPSRTIRFSFAGTNLIKPATGDLRLKVRGRTTIAASRRLLRNGESVRFSGRLRGGPIPEGGKLIDLQAHYRGRWRTFATPRSDTAGRWRFRYRFEATRGLVTYRFRARIPREAAYPYELGYSRLVAVTVRGR